MRKMILAAVLVLTLGVFLPGSARPAVGGSDLPFAGSQTGVSTVNVATGQFHAVSTGPATHFGLTVFEQRGQFIPTGPGTFDYLGTGTLTAANGDQMFGTLSGSVSFSDSIHSTTVIDFVSNGGTGRFADASLSFTGTAHGTRTSLVGSIATGTFESTAVGRLSY